MRLSIFFFYILLLIHTESFALSRLISVSESAEQDVLRFDLQFDREMDAKVIQTKFSEQTLTLTIPEATSRKLPPTLASSLDYVNRLNLNYNKDKTIDLEIQFKDVAASQMKENLSIESAGKNVIVEILPPIWSQASSVDSKEKDLVTSESSPSGETKTVISKKAPLMTEKEIPLFDKKEIKNNGSSGAGKILIMVMSVLALGGALIWWLKNKSKMVNGPESLMKIKVLTQFHLGPKKSLAVVRVAGESLLLGISESQINLIKTLSLLDEDLPEVSTVSFGDALKDKVAPSTEATNAPMPTIEDGELDLSMDEEFSFGPAAKTSFTNKIPLLRRLV